eukprot:scaffold251247_cov17-Tisochrysis_lutea.AAC.1
MVRCGVLVPKTRVDAVPIEACSHQLGTEFSCVILLGFKEGLIPMHSSKLKVQQGKRLPTNVDEERRLAYVAMTRPKSKLFILGPVHGMPQVSVILLSMLLHSFDASIANVSLPGRGCFPVALVVDDLFPACNEGGLAVCSREA